MGRYDKLVSSDKPAFERKQIDKVVEAATPAPVKPKTDRTTDVATSLHQSITTSVLKDADSDDAIAVIHKALRATASSLGSYRCSPMEKKRLEVTVFELKNRSIASPGAEDLKLHENDVIRIAVNHILNEYKANGDDSILVKALVSLRS